MGELRGAGGVGGEELQQGTGRESGVHHRDVGCVSSLVCGEDYGCEVADLCVGYRIFCFLCGLASNCTGIEKPIARSVIRQFHQVLNTTYRTGLGRKFSK